MDSAAEEADGEGLAASEPTPGSLKPPRVTEDRQLRIDEVDLTDIFEEEDWMARLPSAYPPGGAGLDHTAEARSVAVVLVVHA